MGSISAVNNSMFAWVEPSFSATTDPDSDLSDGIGNANSFTDGCLIPMTPDSGAGYTRKRPLIDQRAQTAGVGKHARPRFGPTGADLAFAVEAVGGAAKLSVGDAATAGLYANTLINSAWGAPLAPLAIARTCTGGTTTTSVVADSSDVVVGNQYSIEDDDGNVKVVRTVASNDTGTGTVTWDLALGFTCAASDVIRPLRTWSPRATLDYAYTLRLKHRVRHVGAETGYGFDLGGCVPTLMLEIPEAGGTPLWRVGGMADRWEYRTAENPDVSALLPISPLAPLNVSGSVRFGDAVIPDVSSLSVDPGIAAVWRTAMSGANGHDGAYRDVTKPATATVEFPLVDPNGASVLREADHWKDDAVIYGLRILVGANSLSTDVTNDHNYFAIHLPGVALTESAEIANGGIKYARLTFQTARSEIALVESLPSMLFGIAGKG